MLLGFRDAGKLKTKKVVFEEVYHASDSTTLEQLKELSSRRKMIEESINKKSNITEAIAREMAGGLTFQSQQDLQKLEQYLPLLGSLVVYAESLKLSKRLYMISDLKIQWSSSLSASSSFKLRGPKFFCVDNLRFELGMQMFLYGALLRERAFETLSTDLVESATLFRKAAGVYNYLAMEILPPLQPSSPKERPPEATTHLSSVMSLICLADAQAVTTKKAEEKGTSVMLLSKLHYGVTEILDEATSTMKLRSGEGNDPLSRLLEILSTCKLLHELRSQKYLAEELKGKEQVGTAVAILRYAVANAKKARAPKIESHNSVLSKEIRDVGEMLRKLEHENDFVWHDKIPNANLLPCLQGKSIVSVIPYELQKLERGLCFI